MTPTKKLMINSEPNEIEELISNLYKHPCRY